MTEIYDYLRLLWARIGVPHCPKCGKEIRRQTVDQIVDKIMELPVGTAFQILAPVVRGKKGEHHKILEDARRSGYVRAVWTAVSTTWPRTSPSIRTKSTTSRSWSTA